MFSNSTALQYPLTGNARSDLLRGRANQVFWQVRTAGLVRRLWARVTGRPSRPADLNEAVAGSRVTGRRSLGLRTVNLADINGSEGRSQDFDAQFRPVAIHIRERWASILAAMWQGVTLPPVSLVQVGDNYYIRDGNHRVSVARYIGQRQIDAEVVLWETA